MLFDNVVCGAPSLSYCMGHWFTLAAPAKLDLRSCFLFRIVLGTFSCKAGVVVTSIAVYPNSYPEKHVARAACVNKCRLHIEVCIK